MPQPLNTATISSNVKSLGRVLNRCRSLLLLFILTEFGCKCN